jgi:hypothetical protein
MEGTHLRRDAARPTHILRGNWNPLENPKRDSLWHHDLAGRVLLFLCRSRPSGPVVQRIVGAGGGVRACADERGVACLSANRAPQYGRTPLNGAAIGGHAAVVEQLLAVGAAVDTKDMVGGAGPRAGAGGGGPGGGAEGAWLAEHSSACPLGLRGLCFSKYGFRFQD